MPPHPSKLDCSVWTTSYLWPGSASVAHGNEGKADVITASPALLSWRLFWLEVALWIASAFLSIDPMVNSGSSGNMKNWFWSYNGFHSEACSLLSQRQSSPIFPDIILWKQTCLLLACHKRPKTTTSMYLVVIFGGKFRWDQVCLGWLGCRWEGRRKIQIGYGQSLTKWQRPLSKPTSPHDTSLCNPITSFWQV